MKVDLKCQKCGANFQLEMSKADKGNSINCPRCGTIYKFSNDGLKKVDNALKNMFKDFKSIKINLKF